MLSRSDNELLCRVEPGTPMHRAFKRYWLPAGVSADLPEPDGAPKRATLLCENYVMFRDSAGKVGVLNELCCHRGASLCLARVEEGGIRCIYHGWKFAVDGTILDMPNTTDERYKSRYRQPAYPVVERGGLIWVYLGPKDLQPPPPDYFWLDYPEDKRAIEPVVFECNYTQAIDGGADSSHLTVLHKDALSRPLDGASDAVQARVLASAAPEFDTHPTPFGQFSVAIRRVPSPDGKTVASARTSAFVAPSTVIVTSGRKGAVNWAVAVPETSERTVLYMCWFDDQGTPESTSGFMAYQNIDLASRLRLGIDRSSTDRGEKFSRQNNWAQDRSVMASGKQFTGLPLFLPEDIAVAESAGAIYDRSAENLVPADQAIVRIRRALLEIARDVEAGKTPLGLDGSAKTGSIFVQEVFLDDGDDWRQRALPPEFSELAEQRA